MFNFSQIGAKIHWAFLPMCSTEVYGTISANDHLFVKDTIFRWVFLLSATKFGRSVFGSWEKQSHVKYYLVSESTSELIKTSLTTCNKKVSDLCKSFTNSSSCGESIKQIEYLESWLSLSLQSSGSTRAQAHPHGNTRETRWPSFRSGIILYQGVSSDVKWMNPKSWQNGPNLSQGQQPVITSRKQSEVVSVDFSVDVF